MPTAPISRYAQPRCEPIVSDRGQTFRLDPVAACSASSWNGHEGDREAFSVLAGASISRLYAVANLILRDGDRAQDAVQEALVSAWRDMRALRDPDAWDAWLHRLTVRACYQAARKERRRNVVELQLEPDQEWPGPSTSRVPWSIATTWSASSDD